MNATIKIAGPKGSGLSLSILFNKISVNPITEPTKQLKKIGMLIVQDQVWNRVSQNRGKKATRYYVDEFHLLLKEPKDYHLFDRYLQDHQKQ